MDKSRLYISLVYCFLIIAVVNCIPQLGLTQIKVSIDTVMIIDDQALSINGKFGTAINGKTFQKDIITTYNGYQYIAYYDHNRHMCLSRRRLPAGKWETLRFTDYYFESNDSHNVISMGICPKDGTIHLAFDHHVDTLHYRVSLKNLASYPESIPWTVSSFSPVLSALEKDKPIVVTYPKFWVTPDGNLQFNYRQRGSGNGDRMLIDYNADTGTWGKLRKIDSAKGLYSDDLGESNSRCSYPNGYDYDKNGRLHTSWVWRENSQGANHDLMYAYSDDQGFTWKNNQRDLIDGPINVSTPGITVKTIPRKYGLMNDHGQVIDSKGQVHVVMYHCTEESLKMAGSYPGESRWGPKKARRYHHYWRDSSGNWLQYEMEFEVGNRPKLFVDKDDNLIMIYAGMDAHYKNDINDDFTKRDLVIALATSANKWKDWHIVKVVSGPYINEMLGDVNRWKNSEILSVIVQDIPLGLSRPSPLKVIDFTFRMD